MDLYEMFFVEIKVGSLFGELYFLHFQFESYKSDPGA